MWWRSGLRVLPLAALLLAGCSGGGTTAVDIEGVVDLQLTDAEDPAGFDVSRDDVATSAVRSTCDESTFLADVGDTIACESTVLYADGEAVTVPVEADIRDDGIRARVRVELR